MSEGRERSERTRGRGYTAFGSAWPPASLEGFRWSWRRLNRLIAPSEQAEATGTPGNSGLLSSSCRSSLRPPGSDGGGASVRLGMRKRVPGRAIPDTGSALRALASLRTLGSTQLSALCSSLQKVSGRKAGPPLPTLRCLLGTQTGPGAE